MLNHGPPTPSFPLLAPSPQTPIAGEYIFWLISSAGDETRPACQRCTRVGATCEWGVRVSFRPVHGIPSPERPPTSAATVDQPPIQYNILDVTDSVTREYYHDDQKNGGGASQSRSNPPPAVAHRDGDLQRPSHPSPPEIRRPGTYFPSASAASPSRQAEHAASNLLSLGQTSPFTTSTIGSDGSPEVSNYPHLPPASAAEMTDALNGDIFRPGSTYLNLHSTLRHHIVQESRSMGPSRADSPYEDYDDDDSAVGAGSEEGADFSLTEEQEWVLWVNWLDEVAPGVRGDPAIIPKPAVY